jgi:stage III sporulation protein AB
MYIKIIGAICVVVGCGSVGFFMAYEYRAKMHLLKELISVLEDMASELQYRATPLPQLCRHAVGERKGQIYDIFHFLAEELEAQVSPNACNCMASALDKHIKIDSELKNLLLELGNSLGRFDMQGQLKGLEHSRQMCKEKLTQMMQNKDNRLRSYQTLGLCAGAAIAILFV